MKSLLKEYGIPDKVNNNQIDEVWLYAAPWMSMWESQAVGPRAISINSPPLVDYAYDRTIAVMPMSYERDLGTSLHNFGHRIEATMGRTYNSWEQNRTSHNWDKFGLVKAQSPDYFYSGCGSTHYPPNAFNDYEYGNSASVASSCDSFLTYPNLSTYGQITNQIGCSTWGCTEQGYLTWWFSKIPKFKGVGSDSRANDWWYYILELDNVFRTGEVVTENQ
ncbi:hypothetical protein IT418_02170 [bacterium]|nr:hypothetical protein [bacterium]